MRVIALCSIETAQCLSSARIGEHSSISKTENLMKTIEPLEAQENAGDQVAIGVSFESDWLRKWQTSQTIHRAK